jgi:hypothetical protein
MAPKKGGVSELETVPPWEVSVHRTSVDRYVKANKDVWQVVCASCGVLADDLGMFGAAFVQEVMDRTDCPVRLPRGERIVSDCS